MATKRDYYEILGVSKTAVGDEIKKAYRSLARKHHPDVDKSSGAESRFKEINEAYQVLSDSQKREAYDRFGHAAFEPGSAAGAPGGFRYEAGPGVEFDFDFGGFRDPFDIFEEFFGARSPFSGTARKRGPSPGEDLHYEITIPFEQAAFGVEKRIEISRQEVCPECAGSGAEKGSKQKTCPTCEGRGRVSRQTQSIFGSFLSASTCPTCRGEGNIIEKKCSKCKGSGRVRGVLERSIKIPSGVDDGDTIRFTSLGEAGEKGGSYGDLYLTVRVLPHKFFKRAGYDIYFEQPISFKQAALGDQVEVPTLEGQVKLKIPEGTQTGTEFRLRENGIKYGGSRGDQYVRVKIITPTRLSTKQKEALDELS
ncbi:MAG: molecular chaperone DnaJ [Candidatus Woykebacteria bacterium RBG_13_40_7b]|uniref:Chaperone protein DnaJ n=1 Tax=Candidatus Woykebacteria bacterium RBG_13_40_7b TaxID=1802594 RepID=A0A1G1WC29_9BACT|nr:MAG: molecular chaperone DnaJ [Candidatus Woykebacteria bacterium RBG_13_40_7b]